MVGVIDEKILDKIAPGVQVKVDEKVTDGNKERKSSFTGMVIARKHGNEPGATFTVRAILDGVGVEKIYPIWSPVVTSVRIVSEPEKRPRRSKLYYTRRLSVKKIREKIGA